MAHKFLQGDIVQGNHPPLIPKEIFLKVNGELSKNHSGYEQKIDKEYAPLLGSIKCPCCGKNLSASISTKMRKRFGRTDIGAAERDASITAQLRKCMKPLKKK